MTEDNDDSSENHIDDLERIAAEARRVISLEAETLSELENITNESFGEAVSCLSKVSGRIVITGVGKSGIIASKIASSLSGVGFPACYVHSGDAGHGDLGMITQNDVILVVSKSGESDEILHIIKYAKRKRIPMIGMTAAPQSTLAIACTYIAALPNMVEACKLKLAPTTSTTASLVVGDAIAAALFKWRSSIDEFGVIIRNEPTMCDCLDHSYKFPADRRIKHDDFCGTVSAYVEEAKRVMSLEEKALRDLVDSIDESFSNAVSLLCKVPGRVIITSLGPYATISAKIAASIASTSCPAIFVHAADVAYGGLSMMTNSDAIVAISMSGECEPILTICKYASKAKIPLIAVTQHKESSLARSATYSLLLPQSPEAFDLKSTPTTSVTTSLVLGDAIAVAMQSEVGFSSTEYVYAHPVGRLGRLCLSAEEIMHTVEDDMLPLCHKDDLLQDFFITLLSKRLGCIGVTDDDGTLIGIITESDLATHMADDILQKRAHEMMTAQPIVGHPKQQIHEILLTTRKNNIHHIFIVDPKTELPVGVLHYNELSGYTRRKSC